MSPPELRLELSRLAERITADELRVLVEVARRLKMGRRHYGELRLSGDARDFRKEGAEELVDYVVYDLCRQLREVDESRERKTDPAPPLRPPSGEMEAVEVTNV
jgi:hypothetical protein